MEYTEVPERQKALAKLVGIEDKTWMQVDGFDKVYAISDEDLDRSEQEKTSAVHFMRFELAPEMCAAVKSGAAINAGIEHENYTYSVEPLAGNIRDSLANDLS